MGDQTILLKRLQICDFVLMETALFLDSHPTNKEALAFYNKHLAMREETMAEYTKKYRTINLNLLHDKNTWDWVSDPWPWENSEV